MIRRILSQSETRNETRGFEMISNRENSARIIAASSSLVTKPNGTYEERVVYKIKSYLFID